MSLQDYVNAITAALGADAAHRVPAEQYLQQQANTNLAHHLAMILTVAQSDTVDASVRRLATLLIKLQLKGQSDEIQTQKAEMWFALDAESKNGLKNGVLQLLQSPLEEARTGAAQVIAVIGFLELQRQSWPELIPNLVTYATNADPSPVAVGCKVSSLRSIGFLCEELDSHLVSADLTNNILTALIGGMAPENPDDVKKAAVSALLNTLEFITVNMQTQMERDVIMTKICEGTQSPCLEVRKCSFECIVRIAHLYY
jgi:importin subunit beta-1